MITRIRNYFYDKKWLEAVQPSIFTISVGNITVGGTGKTPHIEYLLRFLLQKNENTESHQITTLSRGYGRKTKGFILANKTTTASEIGDEPMQFYQKFVKNNNTKKVNVVVCEKRVLGVQKILELLPQTKMVLLDDAFQHRAIQPHFSILLSDYNRPFYEDFLLPMGRIRENRRGSQRANIVLVSKCPLGLVQKEKQIIVTEIKKYTKVPIFFTGFDYDKPISLLESKQEFEVKNNKKYSLGVLTGIANYKPFLKYIETKFSHIGKVETQKHFADHYDYKENDIEILRKSDANRIWFTTEKDAVKLRPLLELLSKEEQSKISIFYIPIKVSFLDKNEEIQFQELIEKHEC